jgi:hypothetical protein
LSLNWYDTDYLGIDQGPIVIMIENYRTQSIWNRFMTDPLIQNGLQKAGFHPSTGVHPELPPAGEIALYQNTPNPFSAQTGIRYRLAAEGFVSLVFARRARENGAHVGGRVPFFGRAPRRSRRARSSARHLLLSFDRSRHRYVEAVHRPAMRKEALPN